MNFYNSALVAVDGEILYAYRKLNLPNYGVFEERKYFSSGKQIPVFKYHDVSIAVFICNDLWHPSLPYLGICQKADVMVTIFNSSEGSMGSEFSNIESWGIINTFYARIFGVYNVCANRVGKETLVLKESVSEIVPTGLNKQEDANPACVRTTYNFWGGSEIVNPFGKQVAKAALHQQDEISGEISRDLLRQKRILLPYLRNDDPYFTHRQLDRILYE
jgi:predicted amidohydrolase